MKIPAEFLHFIVIEKVDGDAGRKRIELRAPPQVTAKALGYKAPCVACGRMINPFRERQAPGNKRNPNSTAHVYVAVACPLDVNVGCSRGKKARDAYLLIEHDVDNASDHHQPGLPL